MANTPKAMIKDTKTGKLREETTADVKTQAKERYNSPVEQKRRSNEKINKVVQRVQKDLGIRHPADEKFGANHNKYFRDN